MVQPDTSLTSIGAALGHPVRSAVLLALVAGEPQGAGQLRRLIGGPASALSYHLRILVEAGLITVTRAGRRRVFNLAGATVADALEALLRCVSQPGRSQRGSSTIAFARARSCYDHLAGRLGVDITDALVRRGVLNERANDFELGSAGVAWFSDLGVDLVRAGSRKRSFARRCLDWTEQRPHLAGSLGTELLALVLAKGYVRRLPGGRVLKVTPSGAAWLSDTLGLTSVDRPPARVDPGPPQSRD